MKKSKKKGLLKRLSSIDDIKNNFILTKNLIKNKSKVSKTKHIKETFEEALRRHSIKKEDEEKHFTGLYYRLKITFFAFLMTSLIVCSFTSFQLYTNIDIGYLFYGSYLISAALLIKSTEQSFRCYQLRIRTLGGLFVFLKSPKEWYPKKYIYKELNNG